jgi:drug/metabolite transporter (DMT)-like permease
MRRNSKTINAKIALFGAALIWGSSFLIVKNSMDTIKPHVLLGIRFTVGCILLCIVFHKKLKELNRDYFIKGGILGSCLFAAYSLQTIGITDTTPGKNAFLTAIYCVLVPFMYWLVDKKKPDIYNFVAAIITITGIGFVSLNESFSIRFGDALTLAGGFLFAIHMVAVAKFSSKKDPVLLTILQFGYAAVYAWIIAFFFEDLPTKWSVESVSGLFYLAVFATAIALLLQNIGQKYTKPAQASIILSLECVLGVFFSVVFYHEKLTMQLIVGFLLIFLAVILSETKLGFLKKENLTGPLPEDIYE